MIGSDNYRSEELNDYLKDSDDKEFIKEPVLADDGEEACEGFCKHCGAKLEPTEDKKYCDEAVKEKTATNLYHAALRLVGLTDKEIKSRSRKIDMMAYKALCCYMINNGIHAKIIGGMTGKRSRPNVLSHVKKFKFWCETGNIEALRYKKMIE